MHLLVAPLAAPPPVADERPSLEELAYRFGTDKSHDDHKYTDLYSMLLDPIRDRVQNMTEIGVAAAQSLEMWHTYFPHALVWGIGDVLDGPQRPTFHEQLCELLGRCRATSRGCHGAVTRRSTNETNHPRR